jgi:8-oxo-dGTP pyrophosphatase MutT (NUDIX family)
MHEPVDRPESWPVVVAEDVWSGRAPFSVRSDRVHRPGHPEDTFDRVVLEHPGAVVVLAVDDTEQVVVLQQYRHAPGRRFVELPAGLLDEPGEDPREAAARELREEAMLVAESWTHLLAAYPSPGLTSERIEFYLARGLSPAEDRGGFLPVHEEADMTVHRVPLEDLVAGVLDGTYRNGPLAIAVLAYDRLRRSTPPA